MNGIRSPYEGENMGGSKKTHTEKGERPVMNATKEQAKRHCKEQGESRTSRAAKDGHSQDRAVSVWGFTSKGQPNPVGKAPCAAEL